MKPRRKPDLLFILTVFVGLGIVVSSYIQHTRTSTAPVQAAMPPDNQAVTLQDRVENPLVLVSNPVDTDSPDHDDKGVLVINSSNQP